MKSTFLANKRLGETPLECLERIRIEHNLGSEPLTYAGRLDPMAEGLLLVLAGEECKQKERYLGLDKVYETEFLLGVETDTHDLLGLVQEGFKGAKKTLPNLHISRGQIEAVLRTFLGKRMQAYPAYSSKPHKGTPLFALARAGELPVEEGMPSREVEIYSIEIFGERKVAASELESKILEKIGFVKGDFRQGEILQRWKQFFAETSTGSFPVFSLCIRCSSGTYIRALAHEVGKRLGASGDVGGLGAVAFSIKRTRIGIFELPRAKN